MQSFIPLYKAMPTRELHRTWCVTCQEFELHQQNYPDWDNWFCCECKTKLEKTPIFVKDIPEEKILEQRERYKVSTRYDFDRVFSMMTMGSATGLDGMFSIPGDDVHIIENDAGQKAIDKRERIRREEESAKRQKIREEEKAEQKKFKDVGRNDICLCGSGLKYKKCCWDKISKIR